MRQALSRCTLLIFIVSASALSGRGQSSQPRGYRPEYDRCNKAAGGVTASMLDCNGTEYAYQDKRLNSLYKKLLAGQGRADQAKTRQAERQWISDKEKRCRVQSAGGGTGDTLNYSSCTLDQTVKQADHLQDLLDHSKLR